MDFEYLIVTSIPVFSYNNQYYIDDTWSNDINGQLKLWKNLSVLCPIKKLESKPLDLVKPNENISFVTIDNFAHFLGLISKFSKKKDMIFEFAGTSNYGILGFIFLKFVNGKNLNFITFDAPLSLLIKNNSNISFKKILLIIYVKIMILIRKFAARSSTGLIAVGEGIIDEFDPKRRFKDKYLIIPLTLFNENEIHYKKFFKKENIKIACIDRLADFKGVNEFLKAFKLISNELKNVKVDIFGRGPLEEDLKNFVNNEKLKSRVTFHGFVSHEKIMEELQEIDILVNLSKVGDINRSMWEGAANGCAIIASDTTGVRSFFTNEINALLVNPDNINDIARSLRILCENPETRQKLSKNANNLANKFTNEKVKMMRKNWILEQID